MEWRQLLVMALCAILYPLGGLRGPGAYVPGTGEWVESRWCAVLLGPWIRRFLLPALLGLLLLGRTIPNRLAFLFVLLLAEALSFPYGESHRWLWRFAVGLLYAQSTLPLGFTLWQLILPVGFVALFWLSNCPPVAWMFPWVAVQFVTGALLGATVASLIASR